MGTPRGWMSKGVLGTTVMLAAVPAMVAVSSTAALAYEMRGALFQRPSRGDEGVIPWTS